MKCVIVTFLFALCVESPAQTIDEMIVSAAQSPMAMDHVQDDNTFLLELDMKFSREYMEHFRRDTLELLTGGRLRLKRKAIRPTVKRWTNRIVPYSLSAGAFSSRDLGQINQAVQEWERYTCLDFRLASGGGNRIHLVNGQGCSSYIGMTGGTQYVNLAPGCRVKGVIVHELGHAIGFFHEQSRPDRDNYVTIHFQNVYSGLQYNFRKASTAEINTYNVPYDLRSVMHYGPYAFSSNRQRTIVTRDPSKQNSLGNRNGLTFRDVKLANLMYSCNSHCPARNCPGEGFVGKDCECWCPGNPVSRCGGQPVTPGPRPPTTQRPLPPTARPTTQRPTTPRPTPPCRDRNQYCAAWARRGECTRNPLYMNVHCRRSCNRCSGGGGGGGRTTCVDRDSRCPWWARYGECYRNPRYMLVSCQRSCNRCPSASAASVAGTCRDNNQYCGSWARSGYCYTNAYTQQNCRASCRLC